VHQIGALLYLAWSLLHLQAAHRVYRLGASQPAGMVRGRLYQGAWHLAYFAVFVGVVAVVYNWHNDPLGYWLNLITASVTDVGFVVLLVAPRFVPAWPGLLGPALWILAVIVSTLGLLAVAA
jgi:hypothetical protein